jgi:hypothetical protein
MLLDVGMPCTDVVERTVISHIEYEQNTHSAAVVCGGNSAEALLTSGVPNLQFYPLSVKFYCTDFEVDANCSDERGGPCVIAEPEKETGFSDA